MNRDMVITLKNQVSIPGPNHRPPQTTVFRATERSVDDEFTTFFGLNIGPQNTVIEIANDNIRSIAVLGDETNE